MTGSKLRGGDAVSQISLSEGSIEDLARLSLTPGMTAVVEVKTGERTILSYLLSPVARSVSEAGRER